MADSAKPIDDIPELGPRSGRPRGNPQNAVARVALSPEEGFVLSRIDGTTSFGDICLLSGLGEQKTIEILRRLFKQHLILLPGEKDPPIPLLEKLDDHSPVDPDLLVGAPGLSAVAKTRLIRLHRRLGKLSPEELLGLPSDASKSDVRKAYLGASKELHPDRFFGDDIGPFRAILSEIFTRLTKAFEALEKKI